MEEKKIDSLKKKYQFFVDYFKNHLPNAETELKYANPYQLIVSVILSAQCTDVRVNAVTPKLFERFPTAEKLAEAEIEEVFSYIKSISYPNNKAKHLVGMSKMLVNEFDGLLPNDPDLLQKMPGVGRKTANVLASVLYNKEVIAVDTHVHRVSARIGLTENAKTVLETEKQLVQNFPSHLLPIAHHWLILHGRYVCIARKPQCEKCGIAEICNFFNAQSKFKIK